MKGIITTMIIRISHKKTNIKTQSIPKVKIGYYIQMNNRLQLDASIMINLTMKKRKCMHTINVNIKSVKYTIEL